MVEGIPADYDATDRIEVMNYLHERAAAGEVVTGLLYVNPDSSDLHEQLNTINAPLNQLGDRELCPGAVAWRSKSSTPRCASV